jgi:hypothetical protein
MMIALLVPTFKLVHVAALLVVDNYGLCGSASACAALMGASMVIDRK